MLIGIVGNGMRRSLGVLEELALRFRCPVVASPERMPVTVDEVRSAETERYGAPVPRAFTQWSRCIRSLTE
jgi:hypothetical protein